MANKPKTTKKKAIADIAHPGTTAPSDTSKPIITHRPVMQDPMVVGKQGESPKTEEPIVKRTGELKVEPPKPAEPAESKPSEEKPVPDSVAETETDARPESDDADTPAPDQPSEDSVKNAKKIDPDAEAAAEAAASAKLQSVIDSKKYFLPINAVEHRKSKRFVILGILLAIVLALAWIDVALDAGIIDLGNVKPVTHFFSG
jgi:hypothetical protein